MCSTLPVFAFSTPQNKIVEPCSDPTILLYARVMGLGHRFSKLRSKPATPPRRPRSLRSTSVFGSGFQVPHRCITKIGECFRTLLILLYARVMGLEPTTFRVHFFPYFHRGMDYIIAIFDESNVGVSVSSLYGALPNKRKFPRCSHIFPKKNLAFTVIPKFFNLPFRQKAARLQANALTS